MCLLRNLNNHIMLNARFRGVSFLIIWCLVPRDQNMNWWLWCWIASMFRMLLVGVVRMLRQGAWCLFGDKMVQISFRNLLRISLLIWLGWFRIVRLYSFWDHHVINHTYGDHEVLKAHFSLCWRVPFLSISNSFSHARRILYLMFMQTLRIELFHFAFLEQVYCVWGEDCIRYFSFY